MKALEKVIAGTIAGAVLLGAGWFVNRNYISLDRYTANARAEIKYTRCPSRGGVGYASGKVILQDASNWDYKVATFIKVGGKWWPKPYWNNQSSSIASDGTFNTKITTGGNDEYADEICSAVVRKDYPKVKKGACISEKELPNTADKRVLAVTRVDRNKEDKDEK